MSRMNNINIRTHWPNVTIITMLTFLFTMFSFWPWILWVLWRNWNSKSINWKKKMRTLQLYFLHFQLKKHSLNKICRFHVSSNLENKSSENYMVHSTVLGLTWPCISIKRQRILILVNVPHGTLTLLSPRNKQTVVRLQRSCWNIQGLSWSFKWNKIELVS